MKGMLIKDFSLLKGQKQFFMIAIMFAFIFLFLTDMAGFGVSYLMVMFTIFTLSTIAYDGMHFYLHFQSVGNVMYRKNMYFVW